MNSCTTSCCALPNPHTVSQSAQSPIMHSVCTTSLANTRLKYCAISARNFSASAYVFSQLSRFCNSLLHDT